MRNTLFFLVLTLFFSGCNNDNPSNEESDQTNDTEQAIDTEGPDFSASGVTDEVTWELSMEFGGDINFSLTTKEGETHSIVALTPDVYPLSNPTTAVRYRINSTQETLTVTIFPYACQDSETGEKFDNQVIVKAQPYNYAFEETLQGCGNFKKGHTVEGIIQEYRQQLQ